jgi:hypothetical protein
MISFLRGGYISDTTTIPAINDAIAASRLCPHDDQAPTIPRRRPDDPRQHAQPRRQFAVRVVLAMSPSSGAERRALARSHPGAELRAADGVHELRHRRRRRAAELTRAAAAREPDGDAMAPTLSLADVMPNVHIVATLAPPRAIGDE